MSELGDRIKEKLRKASAGQIETWGFVAMFMEMIDEAEEEIKSSDHAPNDLLIRCRAALEKAVETIHIWHGKDGWSIYLTASPEMKQINAVREELTMILD